MGRSADTTRCSQRTHHISNPPHTRAAGRTGRAAGPTLPHAASCAHLARQPVLHGAARPDLFLGTTAINNPLRLASTLVSVGGAGHLAPSTHPTAPGHATGWDSPCGNGALLNAETLLHRCAVALTCVGWGLAIASGLVGLPDPWQDIGTVSLVIFFVIHPLEVAFFLPRLRKGGAEDLRTAVLIGLFGVIHLWGRSLRARTA